MGVMSSKERKHGGPFAVTLLLGVLLYLYALHSDPLLKKTLFQGENEPNHPIGLWAQFPQGMDDDTKLVQAVIHENQNPRDCNKRNFFLWTPLNWGMGSDIHTIGIALGFAIHHNRTLLYNPESDWKYTSPDGCPGTSTPDCFFRHLSHCQWMTDYQTTQSLSRFDIVSQEWTSDQFVILDLDNEDKLLVKERGFIPDVADWRARSVSWWRSQTTRYIVQPLPSLLSWTRDFFAENLYRYPPSQEWSPKTRPPPNRALCIHVRHGDKVVEMKLHPMEDYLSAAADAASRTGVPRDIFLSTDDSDVIDGVETGRYDHWNFTYYYTRYERPKQAVISPMATADLIGRGQFGRISLANLVLAVHPVCEAFVQTTGSNWNRLINEIRKTDGRRQDALWIDLEEGEWRRG